MKIYKNKNFLVYGMCSSGIWAVKLLNKLKANIYIYDDNKDNLINKPVKNCFVVQELNEILLSSLDYIIVSPGVPLDKLQFVEGKNIKIYSEVEFASQFAPKLVAVTGTNGKTTTVQLINAMLSQKYKSISCGNIGYPLSRAILEKKKHIKVVEMSSFMLEHAETFSPHVATITNIEADHLVRHKSMTEYTKLKYKIFNNLKTTDYIVVNLDSNILPNLDCMMVTYSYKGRADVYCKNGVIYLHQDKIVAVNELHLIGKHNIYNIMCAICYAYIYKVPVIKIREVLLKFKLDNYRIEEVDTINGIKFINDSKSTNIASTLASCASFQSPIILLLGGSKKNLDYKELFIKLPKRVRKIFAYGEIKDDLQVANANKFDLEICKDMTVAFQNAVNVAKRNDIILLSPASASYDQFDSYIERGKKFDELVNAYANEVEKE